MNASLTIVLPVHNTEATLRTSVRQTLEVASELTSSLELLIFDDGSTDDSYDIANELALEYPQVRVARHSRRRGMGVTLRAARRRAAGDLVIVHDGASAINAEELAAVWRAHLAGHATTKPTIDDLLLPARTQSAMEAAHRRVTGFRLLDGGAPQEAAPAAPHADRTAAGIGSIPTLPRPNFLGAIGEFARGE